MNIQKPLIIEAEVRKVKKGRGAVRDFAIAYPTEKGATSAFPTTLSISFSFEDWHDDNEPKVGQIVMLTDIHKFAQGWRSRNATPVVATDNQEGQD